MSRARRRARCTSLAVASVAALVVATAGPAHGAPAHAAGACSVRGAERTLGPTYVTKLSVSGGVSCAAGKSVVRAYYRCRLAHGGKKGKCSAAAGYRCTEQRYAVIPVQFSAHVTCTAGRRGVQHDYTQFT